MYEAIKKISKGKWEWEPQVGEWYISPMDIIHLIPERQELSKDYQKLCIPLLHWERIEEILEGIGLGFGVWRTFEGVSLEMYWLEDNPNQDPCVIIEKAKSRQEAAYKAVIELAKED